MIGGPVWILQVSRLTGLSTFDVGPFCQHVVVEHRDRLAGFGAEHLDAMLAGRGRGTVVLDDDAITCVLERETVEVLTALCALVCGRGDAHNRALRAVTRTKQAESVTAARGQG